MELTFFYPSVYKEIFSSLGISKESVQKIERIYKNIQDFKEDPLFISNLREWLSKSENHYDLYIDYWERKSIEEDLWEKNDQNDLCMCIIIINEFGYKSQKNERISDSKRVN